MPEYEILQGSPELTLSEAAGVPRVAADARTSDLSMDEAGIMDSGPSFDPSKRDPNAFRLFGKNAMDSTLKVLLDNPVTNMRAIGKEIEENPDTIEAMADKYSGGANRRKKIMEKYTAVSTAIRDLLDMSKDELSPSSQNPVFNFFEQIIAGVGGAIPSIGVSAAASAAGGGAAVASGAGPKAVTAAKVAGAAFASFSMEKPVLEKELLDAGFEGGFADRMSTFYAIPVAMLDAGSFGFLTGTLKPVASQAVSTTVGRLLARRALQFEASATGGIVTKALVEGSTEAIQGQIQSEFEMRLGLENRDFQRDLSSRVVEFVVGALMGGAFGAAHTAGQLESRKAAITEVSQKHNLAPSKVAEAYDASTLEAIDRTLDELSKDRGDAVSAQVAERVKTVQMAIDRSMGRTTDIESIALKAEQAIQPTADQLSKAQETLLRGESQIVKAKVREIQGEIRSEQKKVIGLKQELASIERELRLLKSNPLTAFKEQEGRDPKGNELGNWVMSRSASLEGKVVQLTQQSDVQQGRVVSARQTFREAIKNLPEAEKITAIEDMIARKNAQIEQLSVAEDPKALEKASKLSEEIKVLEEELAKYGQPEARVQEAEQALDSATVKLETMGVELDQAEARLRAVRADGLTEFITEKNRSPKEGELEIWKREEISKAKEAIAKIKQELSRQLQVVQNLTAEAEAYQLGLEKVTGSIRIGSGVIRQQSLSIIRQFQRGFFKGGKLAVKEANGVIRVMQQMVTSLPISDKRKVQFLRRIRAISVEQFNEKLPQFMAALNDIVAIERVQGLQKVAADILDKMSDAKARNTAPKIQLLSKKLSQILSGNVEASRSVEGNKTSDIAQHAIENLVAELAGNDTDVAAAERAVTALKDFYSEELTRRLSQIEQVKQDDQRLADAIVSGLRKGGKINPRKASLDSVRQKLQQIGMYTRLFPSTYLESFLTIANDIDAGQGAPNMQGAMVKNFDPGVPYRAWMTLVNRTREAIDNKLVDIYGPKFLETLTLNRTANFIDVEFGDSFLNKEGEENAQGQQIEKINITKSAAMSLYMMQRNAKIREQLIDLGYNENWLDNFARGDVFDKQDHAWMAQVDTILQGYAEQIAPLYEKLTGKPFRLVDQYFMVQRYMFSEEGKATIDTPSVVKDLLAGVYESVDPTNDPRFKMRTKSAREFVLPDITEAITRYSSDMNHFIAYAEYATKLDALLKNEEFISRLETQKTPGISKVLHQFLKNIVDGSDSRTSDRAAMSVHFRALGWLARNKIVSPRSGFMQFTALAGFTDPTTSTPVNTLELAQAALDLPDAIKSGELKNLLDTGYMKERWLGAFDQAAHMAEEMSRSAVFSKQGRWDPAGILRKLGTNKTLHEWMTISTRFGDRAPSVVGGWAVYKKVLAKTGDKQVAVGAAIKMIEEVNGSLDPGKSAEIYSRSDFVSTLFKLFTRSTSIYLDRYLRLHKAGVSGQISKADYAKGLALYHVWIPMFTSAVAMGAGSKFDDDEMKTMMLSGPLAYHLFIGIVFKTIAAATLQATGFNEKFAAGYDQGGDLLDGVGRDMKAAFSKAGAYLESPDMEGMWEAVAYAGKAMDFLPLPAGYLSRQPEALMKILQGDYPEGLMEIMGYSSAATKVE